MVLRVFPGDLKLNSREKRLYIFLLFLMIGVIIAGIIHQGFDSVIKNLLLIQTHSGRLINDFTKVGGAGAALVNAALAALIGLLFIYYNKVSLSGPTIAAFLTIFGFGLFGKTPFNILSIFLGVFISARIIGKKFQEYILIALFGTALGPLVTFLTFKAGFTGFPALLIGMMAGTIVGMFLPAVAKSMLHLHQGYNLYNIGLSCGFLGLFAAAILRASGYELPINVVWNKNPPAILVYLIPVVSLLFIIAGIIERKKDVFKDFKLILHRSGRLPSDFVDIVSQGGAMFNIGVIGICFWLYILAIGGDLNGPVLGGIFTIMGFGAFGKHPVNCWPIIMGVVVACKLFGYDLAAPGPILGTLFATTLAPIAGRFGIFAGITAGFLHLVMVMRTAEWHGGLDLYNNGFAGGLTATLIIIIIEWYREEVRNT